MKAPAPLQDEARSSEAVLEPDDSSAGQKDVFVQWRAHHEKYEIKGEVNTVAGLKLHWDRKMKLIAEVPKFEITVGCSTNTVKNMQLKGIKMKVELLPPWLYDTEMKNVTALECHIKLLQLAGNVAGSEVQQPPNIHSLLLFGTSHAFGQLEKLDIGCCCLVAALFLICTCVAQGANWLTLVNKATTQVPFLSFKYSSESANALAVCFDKSFLEVAWSGHLLRDFRFAIKTFKQLKIVSEERHIMDMQVTLHVHSVLESQTPCKLWGFARSHRISL